MASHARHFDCDLLPADVQDWDAYNLGSRSEGRPHWDATGIESNGEILMPSMLPSTALGSGPLASVREGSLAPSSKGDVLRT